MFIRLLKWMMAAMVINIALTPWGTPLIKVAGYATILLTIGAAAVSMQGNLRIELNKGTKAILIFLVMMIVGLLIDFLHLEISFDLLQSIVCFFSFYILINKKPQIHRAKDLKDIFLINKLLACVYIAYTLLPFSFRYTEVNEWGAMGFTLSMGNTNATAMMAVFCVALLCLEIKRIQKRFHKIVNVIMVLVLLYMLLLLQSRTAMACALLIAICTWFKKLKLRPWYGVVILLVPMAYFILQITIRELDGITILGKALNTGRGKLFVEYLSQLKAAPERYIVGSVVTHQFANYHNAPIAILSNFGIIGLIGYLMFWGYQFKTFAVDSQRTAFQSLAAMVLFAFMLHSSAEALPMLGGIPYSSAMILITRLAKDQFGEPMTDEGSLHVKA